MNGPRELVVGGRSRPKSMGATQQCAGNPFDYPASQVGVSGSITVYAATALGDDGRTLAQQVIPRLAAPYSDMETFFGIPGSAVQVVVAPLGASHDGSQGAYHCGCDFTSGGTLYLDATFGSTTVNPLDLLVGLYVAELSESFMGPQGKGWGCGFSNGEGLSRFCSEQATPPGTMDLFITGPTWAAAGFADWVSQTAPTDTKDEATGCAVVYLYWMRSRGFTIPQIVQAGGATLAANYQSLTGLGTAYQDLSAAVNGLAITSDNPFPPAVALAE